VVDAFTEQTEASTSIDPPGSIRQYMVLELKEARNGALVPAPEKEGQGTEEPSLPQKMILFITTAMKTSNLT
jgi:hypothetical protein